MTDTTDTNTELLNTTITVTETDTTITAIARITVPGCNATSVKMIITEEDEQVFVRSQLNGQWIKARNIIGRVATCVNAIEDHLAYTLGII